jgi:hypothetical protein
LSLIITLMKPKISERLKWQRVKNQPPVVSGDLSGKTVCVLGILFVPDSP